PLPGVARGPVAAAAGGDRPRAGAHRLDDAGAPRAGRRRTAARGAAVAAGGERRHPPAQRRRTARLGGPGRLLNAPVRGERQTVSALLGFGTALPEHTIDSVQTRE